MGVLLVLVRVVEGTFLFGQQEKDFLTNYLDTRCPVNHKLCATMNVSRATLSPRCIRDETGCSGKMDILLERVSTCDECSYTLCTEEMLCTSETSLCMRGNSTIGCSCVTRGTWKKDKNDTCLCRPGFSGDRCEACHTLKHREYLCCEVNILGLEIALVSSKQDDVHAFLRGKYTDGRACLSRNESMSNNGTSCDCLSLNNPGNQESVDPEWLASALITGINREQAQTQGNDLDTKDSAEGIVAFALAIAIGSICCLFVICGVVIFFVGPKTKTTRKNFAREWSSNAAADPPPIPTPKEIHIQPGASTRKAPLEKPRPKVLTLKTQC